MRRPLESITPPPRSLGLHGNLPDHPVAPEPVTGFIYLIIICLDNRRLTPWCTLFSGRYSPLICCSQKTHSVQNARRHGLLRDASTWRAAASQNRRNDPNPISGHTAASRQATDRPQSAHNKKRRNDPNNPGFRKLTLKQNVLSAFIRVHRRPKCSIPRLSRQYSPSSRNKKLRNDPTAEGN